MKTVYIYALLDPDTQEARYVGRTVDMKSRLATHCSNSMFNTGRKADWIRGLLSQGKKPFLSSLEACNEKNWREGEKKWITHFKSAGCALLNDKAGGEGVGYEGPVYVDGVRVIDSHKSDKKKVSVLLDIDEVNILDQYVEEHNTTRADVIREAIALLKEKLEKDAKKKEKLS